MRKNINCQPIIFKALTIISLSLLIALFQSANAGTVLYAIDSGSSTASIDRNLYTVDTTTGTVSTIGAIGHTVSDLAWDRTRGKLYGAVKSRTHATYEGLVEINTTTGAGTTIGDTGWKFQDGTLSGYQLTQMEFDNKGNLYGADQNGLIIKIDPGTGIVTPAPPVFLKDPFGNTLDSSLAQLVRQKRLIYWLRKY